MMRYVLLLMTLICAFGCAPKQPTRDEILALKVETDAHRTRTYQESPGAVLAAAEKVLMRSDDDYRIMPGQTDNVYRAKRTWMMFMLFSNAIGEDHWEVTAKEADNGETSVSTKWWTGPFSAGLIPMQISSGGDATNYGLLPPLYDLFYERLDYMLGKRKDWPTCKDAEKRLKSIGKSTDELNPLCQFANVEPTTE